MDNYQKLFDCPDSNGATSDVEYTDNIAYSSGVDDIEDYSSIVESETETSESIQDRNENKEAPKEETEVVKSNDSTYKNSYEDDSSENSWERIIGTIAVLILIGMILFAVANSCSSDKADQEEQTTTESTSYPEPSTSSTSSQSYEGSSSHNSSESEISSNGSETSESVSESGSDSEEMNVSKAIKMLNSKTPFDLGHSLTLTECSYDPYKNVVFMRIIVEKMDYFYDPEANTQHVINVFSSVQEFSDIFKAVEASFELQFLNNQDNNWTEGKFSALDL